MFQPDSIKSVLSSDSIKSPAKKVLGKTEELTIDSPTTVITEQTTKVVKSNNSVPQKKQLNQKNTSLQKERVIVTDSAKSVNLDNTREPVNYQPVTEQKKTNTTSTLNDTSTVLDSTKSTADSITLEPIGYSGNKLPENIYGSTSLFVLFIFLLITLSVAISSQKQSFFQSIKSLFVQNKEISDSFKASKLIKPRDYVLNSLFTIGIWSIALNFFYNPFLEPFSIKTFLYRAGLLIIYVLAKHVLFEIVGRTFFGVKQMKFFKSYYFNIFFYTSILLLPILICYVYIPEIRYIKLNWILIGILTISYISLLFKLLQTFYTKILDLFYIFLYFCTLEIIPLGILIGANNFTDF